MGKYTNHAQRRLLMRNLQKTADSLPEIQSTYSDVQWTFANHTTTVNPRTPTTPVVLYAGDYGFHTGNIIWRAHFTAKGSETGLQLQMIGGLAFGYSVWLDDQFIGSWEGDAPHTDYNSTHTFPQSLKSGSKHVLTILQDHMGYEEDYIAASETFKTPRGVLGYDFVGSDSTTVDVWKVTGNLGGESVSSEPLGSTSS